jgi:hypothetical protein
MTSRAALFSTVATAVYTLAFYGNWPRFRYYLNSGFHLAPQPESAGHVIFWYGWLATAAVIGALAALLAPRKMLAGVPEELGWMVPVAMVIATLAYEKRWFF